MMGTHDYVVSDLSLPFQRRRESIGHHSDPHWGSFLESTESFMLGSIFSGASIYRKIMAGVRLKSKHASVEYG